MLRQLQERENATAGLMESPRGPEEAPMTFSKARQEREVWQEKKM